MNPAKEFEKMYSQMVQFDGFFGLHLNVIEPGNIVYDLKIEKHHLTSPEACHGGVISAMMDAVLGVTALSWAVSKGNLCSTVEFKVNYLSPGRPGDRLRGTASIDFSGSSLIVTSGYIEEISSKRMIAKGMGTFSQYPMKKMPPNRHVHQPDSL
jgi:uncharacterized protein (TIGR00369 family)